MLGWVLGDSESLLSLATRRASRMAASKTRNQACSVLAWASGNAVRSMSRPRPIISTKGVSGSTRSAATACVRGPCSQCVSQLFMLESATYLSRNSGISLPDSLGNMTSQRISGGVWLSMRVCTPSTYWSKTSLSIFSCSTRFINTT